VKQVFDRISVHCKDRIEQSLFCKSKFGTASKECQPILDQLRECYVQNTCPKEYTEASECMQKNGSKSTCAAALKKVDNIVGSFWGQLTINQSHGVLNRSLKKATKKCNYAISAKKACFEEHGETSPDCVRLKEESTLCFVQHFDPYLYKVYTECVEKNGAPNCINFHEAMERVTENPHVRVLQSIGFSEKEIHNYGASLVDQSDLILNAMPSGTAFLKD